MIRAAIEAHRTLGGPGLLESVYEEALAWEIQQSGLAVERQVVVPVQYKQQTLSAPLRLDMLVQQCVIVEVKATVEYNPIFEAQALTYLRFTQPEARTSHQLRREAGARWNPSCGQRAVAWENN